MRAMRFGEVRGITGLSRTTVWRLERAGKFPPRRRLSTSSVGWIDTEVLDWLGSREQPLRQRSARSLPSCRIMKNADD